MREIEKIINNPTAYNTTIYVDGFNCTVKQLIKQAYNLGLQDAADNAETIIDIGLVNEMKVFAGLEPVTSNDFIYKPSILKLKI